MGTVESFIKSQWLQIRGNVKYGALIWLCGGGSVLTAFLSYVIQRLRGIPKQDWIGYLILAVLMFLAMCAVMLLSRNSQNLSNKNSNKTEKIIPTEMKGEISEIYFYKQGEFIPFQRMFVLVKAQIVNHGQDERVITRWGLQICIGAFMAYAESVDIPASWRIKKRREDTLNIAYAETDIGQCLSTLPHNETYRKGIPVIGWLLFEFSFVENIEFPNAEFNLSFLDSLGGMHKLQKLPTVYVKTGEIVAN